MPHLLPRRRGATQHAILDPAWTPPDGLGGVLQVLTIRICPHLIPYRTLNGRGAAAGKNPSLSEQHQSVSPYSMLSPSLRERLYATPPPESPMIMQEKMQNAERKRKERSTSSSCARRPR